MQLFGLISLSDRLRADVPDVLRFLREHGIAVKMLTGDTFEIASDVAKSLGFTGSLLRREVVDDTKQLASVFASAAGFAEMLPKDKLTVVLEAAKQHTVAVTGDGVNDVPAVKAADVGIAVKNAVDALRGTADIVLLSDGLGVIKDAIIEARQIFARLYHYSVFRIAESFRVIVTIAIIGLILGAYPLSPVQLILLALLNDIPVVSIAFDRVRIARAPAAINVRRRFLLSTILGITGVGNSLLMLALATAVWHLPWELIQTVFFLKLVVSGHLMIYLAHTDERWWRFLPSRSVILATLSTQLLATLFAVVGIFAAAISWQLALFVWLWAFVWMQVGEFAKYATQKFGQRQ
jgi:H+-transporting ATPase